MPRQVAILQSSYIPWRGVFDFIDRVDLFVLYDDVQLVKRHWHNRNIIKTAGGPLWLSIPIETKGRYHQKIDETVTAGSWTAGHWKSIGNAYAKAPFFAHYADTVATLYRRAEELTRLSEINHLFLTELSRLLGIETPFRWSSEFAVEGSKTDRLLALCRAVEADAYLSGPSAASYIEPDKFVDAGIDLQWIDYGGYQPYPQLHGAFSGQVTILDMLFNLGPETLTQIRADRRTGGALA